ncbi:hypothetical protein HDF16_005609 [Granulicella aggregans]|uniref:Uncharacterized protein n=1 Tax=Granulicella aggregans TaxID=474949 RepID=A0A7W8E662_9BACT|nr:hypothetical protein [Granulicella aggregans]MBB5060873.1 hypothetical protein [Granulicella aggregans]
MPATSGDFDVDSIELRAKIGELSDAQDTIAILAAISYLLKIDLPRYEKDLVVRQKEMEDLPDVPKQPSSDEKDRRRMSAEAIIAGEQKYTEIECPVLAIFADPS